MPDSWAAVIIGLAMLSLIGRLAYADRR